ncbi:MAG: isocitrate/isopropylmalate family dehydrogenase, partial [Thermomicrobiales bacterium]
MSSAQAYRIAVIPGDGIGQEVIPEGLKVLEAVGQRFGLRFDYEHFPWGSDYYHRHGV